MKQLAFVFFICLSILGFGQVKPEVVLTTGHSDQVNAMVVSPDGRFLASAGNEKILKIWEIGTTQEYRTISGMSGRIYEMIFASDSKHIAAITDHGEVLVWNALTGEKVYEDKNGSNGLKGIAFSPDDSKLYHGNTDGFLTITSLESKQTKELDVLAIDFAINPTRDKIFTYDQLGKLHYVDLNTESLVKSVQLFDEFVYPFSNSEVSPDGKFLATGFDDNVIRLIDLESGTFAYESEVFNEKVVSLTFDPVASYLYFSLSGGRVIIFDYEKMKVRKEIQESVFRTQALTGHPRGNIVIMASHNEMRFYNVKKKETFKLLKGKVSPVVNMAYDPNGDFLAVASDKINIQIWDLKLNKTVATINGFFPCAFSPDGKYLIGSVSNLDLGVWEVETGEQIGTLKTNFQIQKSLTVSPDGKNVAAGGMSGEISVWDIESQQKLKSFPAHAGIINAVDYNRDGKLLASASYDQTAKVWDLESGEELHSFTDQTICISDVKFSPDGKHLASSAWDRTIYLRSTEDWSVKHVLEGHTNMINSLDFNKDGSVLVSGAANNAVQDYDNSVRFWDVNSGKEICKIQDHLNGISKVVFDETNDRAYSASQDGTIKINDYKKCEVIATYVAVQDEDFMIYTPDHYYMASRKALLGMAFRINNELVSFEQFDAYLNRPDIVADRIGKSPPQLIRAYEYLYKKRMRKLDLDGGELKIDYKVPKLVNETELDLATTDKSIDIWVKAWDDEYQIQQINVFVNDVPILGESGYRPEDPVKSIRKQFKIPLVNGSNKIQLSCVNSNGAESLYETIDIIRQGNEEKNDLYIVAIGVSNYEDDRFELTYPTKDARDMVAKITESKELYNQVHTKLLLDEEVTIENFETLADFFKNASHEDMAVIFIAGHGVLDANFDYFYGTHNMDFDDPSKKGLAYDRIHSLLNSLKPYKKLLIMDTCHSGELDKEEVEEGPAPEKVEGNIEFRAAGVAVRKKQGFGLENSVELMEDLFADTRKGSGATVISSAGGAEYAMESDKWKNGLFTYAFLSGLESLAADFNFDGKIQVSEIRRYVHDKVENLSGGKQIPSSREENISQDYIIFGR